MITKEEIKKLAHNANLSPATVEKDYVLGWILQGIGSHPLLSKAWAFKGGNVPKKMLLSRLPL